MSKLQGRTCDLQTFEEVRIGFSSKVCFWAQCTALIKVLDKHATHGVQKLADKVQLKQTMAMT